MSEVNYLAVLACGFAAMFIGSLWYSPLLFGNIWMKLSGITMKDAQDMKKRGMAMSYVINFIAALVMAYVLANVAQYGGADTAVRGMMLGLWMWLGFVGTTTIGMVLWDGKPWRLYLLINGYQLIALMVMGAILASWPVA